jgi:cytochrome P450
MLNDLLLRLGLLYRRDPQFMLALGKTECPATRLRLPGYCVYALHDPALIRQLLTRQHTHLSKGGSHRRAQGWLGASPLVAEGEEHRRLRRVANAALRAPLLPSYRAAMERAVAQQIAGWQAGELRDLALEMRQLATSALLMAFADSTERGTALALDDALAVLTPSFGARRWPWAALAERRPGSAAARRAQAQRHLDMLLYQLIDGEAPTATPLLNAVYEASGAEGYRAAARDMLATLLLAGRETVASALCWIWWLLATHPERQGTLYDALLADETAGMRQIEYVVAETLRLYPPAWAMARRTLGAVELEGLRIPAGAIVLFSQLALHRDARFFSEPERFQPERWAAAPHHDAFLPFGAGPRRCPGVGFAMLELTLVVATIARRWRFYAAPGQAVRLVGGPALMPHFEVRSAIRWHGLENDQALGLPLRLELVGDVAANYGARQPT